MAGNTLGMATQSSPDPVPVLLTRPDDQSRAFAAALNDRFGDRVRSVMSPLMRPDYLSPDLPPGPFAAVIFTSLHGVTAALPWRDRLPRLAWCVGSRTAQEAQAAGFQTRAAEGDADSLVAAILADPPPGPLLHLRGEDQRGDVAARLTLAGHPTQSAIVYRQSPQPLSPQAAELLRRPGVVIVPLFSPRSAELLLAALPSPTLADLRIGAISAATAQVWTRGAAEVARRPDADAMLEAVGNLIAAAPPP